MLRTKLLFLSLVVYVSSQGVSYYGGSNVRNQNRLPPRLPDSNRPAYTHNAQPIRPVYNPQPVYQSPHPVQSDQPIYQQPQNQPGVSQPSPVRRPPQLTFGSRIPDSQEYIPEPAIRKEIPPKPIYSIPPQPATNPQPTRPINSYPKAQQPWSWGPARPTETPEEIIQENASPPNSAQVVYPKSLYAPSFGSKAVDVESLTEHLPALVEEPAVELQSETETDVLSSLPEGSQPDIQVNTQPELPEPAIPESFSEIELPIPRPIPPSYSDLRPFPEEPSIDTIYEPLSSPEPIPISNQQPPAKIPLVPRPLPLPGLVIFPEPQPIPLKPDTPVQPPPPIDSAPSQPSYHPKEPVKPEASAHVNTPSRPNYQPVLPPRPSYQIPAPIPIPVSRPLQPQPTPTYPDVPPTQNTLVPAPDVPPIISIADFQCSKGTAYYTIINECDAYIKCQRQRAWKHTCPDGLHFNPRASYPEYPCAYPSEVKCESTAFKQTAQPTKECPNRYGFFPLSGEDCSRYLMCQEGKAILMNCPFGLVFNDELSSCDWPENVPQCHLSAFKDFTCPIPPEDDPDLLSRYRFGNECRLYVACRRGHPRLLSCDSGLSFDENSQVCIDSDLVKDCRFRETKLY